MPAQQRKPALLVLSFLAVCVIASLVGSTGAAYLASPGKYCGVVVFDRWGSCFLLSGPLIIHISKRVSGDLLRYNGKAMQVDAQAVTQGGMHAEYVQIDRYRIVGPAPDTNRWHPVGGLQLVASDDFGATGKPRFVVEIRNAGKSAVRVDRSLIGIVLLKSGAPDLSVSDEVSTDLIRGGVGPESFMNYAQSNNLRLSWGYTVDMRTRPPAEFVIAPGQLVRIRLTFKLYPGEYQFIFGYGGGAQMDEKSIASNAISFDMNDTRRATPIK